MHIFSITEKIFSPTPRTDSMAATLQRRLRVLRRRGRRASCARQRGIEGTDSESESPRRSLLCAFTCDKCGTCFLKRGGVWKNTERNARAHNETRERVFLILTHSAHHACTHIICVCVCVYTGERSVRRVNPLAYERGTVFVQCQHEPCGAWHQLKDNLHLIDEVRFFDEDNEEKKSTDGG